MATATTQNSLKRDDVLALLSRLQAQYEAGDTAFFDNFAKDATFFTLSSPTRIDSVEEYRRGFEPFLTNGKTRRSQILSPHIQIIDSSAAVSYHNRISVDGDVTNMRVSLMVQRKPDGGLEIVQFHTSYLSQPVLAANPTANNEVGSRSSRVEDINLIEERVAVAAATVGTPK